MAEPEECACRAANKLGNQGRMRKILRGNIWFHIVLVLWLTNTRTHSIPSRGCTSKINEVFKFRIIKITPVVGMVPNVFPFFVPESERIPRKKFI